MSFTNMYSRQKSISFFAGGVGLFKCGRGSLLITGESQSVYKIFDKLLGKIWLPILCVWPDLHYGKSALDCLVFLLHVDKQAWTMLVCKRGPYFWGYLRCPSLLRQRARGHFPHKSSEWPSLPKILQCKL